MCPFLPHAGAVTHDIIWRIDFYIYFHRYALHLTGSYGYPRCVNGYVLQSQHSFIGEITQFVFATID